MENLPLGIRTIVLKARLNASQIISPSAMGLGIFYDKDPAQAVAALDQARMLVVARESFASLPGAVLATFSIDGELVFSDDGFAVYRKKDRPRVLASWLKQAMGGRINAASATSGGARPMNGIYVDPRTVLTTTWWGDMIYVVSVDASITPHILRQGQWEHWIEEAFRRTLRPGMHVVDIGCNVGYYALAACQVVGPHGYVTAIDANPEMTRLVEMSLACNGYGGMTRVVNAAVMREVGEVTLSVPNNMLGGGSTIFAAGGDQAQKVRVSGAPLDQLVASGRMDVIKMDAEGAEPLIYAGAKSIISSTPDLIMFMEFSASMIAATRPPQDFLNEIRNDGFHVFEIRPGEGPVAVADAELVDKRWTEVMLTRNPERAAQ